MDYAQLCNEPAVLEKCQEIATNATWGIKLGRLKVIDWHLTGPMFQFAICHFFLKLKYNSPIGGLLYTTRYPPKRKLRKQLRNSKPNENKDGRFVFILT